MRIWILDDEHFPTGYANGLIESKYPERKKQYLACTVADVFGSACERSLNVQRMLKPSIGFWEIGNPVDYAERANNRLLALTALRFEEDGRLPHAALGPADRPVPAPRGEYDHGGGGLHPGPGSAQHPPAALRLLP